MVATVHDRAGHVNFDHDLLCRVRDGDPEQCDDCTFADAVRLHQLGEVNKVWQTVLTQTNARAYQAGFQEAIRKVQGRK